MIGLTGEHLHRLGGIVDAEAVCALWHQRPLIRHGFHDDNGVQVNARVRPALSVVPSEHLQRVRPLWSWEDETDHKKFFSLMPSAWCTS